MALHVRSPKHCSTMARQDPQRQQTAQKLAIAPAFTGCPPMHGFLSQKPHEDPYHAYVAPDAHQYRRGSSAATHGPPDTSYRYPKSIDINDDGTAVQSADKRPTVNPFGPYHGEPGHGAKRSTNVTRPSHDKPARMGNGNHQHFISKQHNQSKGCKGC